MGSDTRGLGRGLDALLGGSKSEDEVNPAEVRQILISSIIPNKHQPRIEFSKDALEDLAASIKAQGVLQPILVRPLGDGSFELVAGERRMRASRIAGLREMPALVREMTDEQSLAIALIENLQREDLNAIEEAKGYKQLMDEFGLSQEALASQVGKSRSSVANALRLLRLPGGVQQDISAGVFSAGHGRALMSLENGEGLQTLASRVKELGLSVRQTEAEASFFNQNGIFPDTAAPSKPAPGRASGKKAAAIDGSLLEIQALLEQEFGIKVSIGGSPVRGKISFQFASAEELDALVDKLGVDRS